MVRPPRSKPAYRPFLLGQRVLLREVRASDLTPRYYQWMNDPEVTQYTESRFYPYSRQRLTAFLARAQRDSTSVFLAIIERAGRRHLGNIKLGPIQWIHRLAPVNLIIGDKARWGRGFATEAIGLLCRYAFDTLQLHKLTAWCYADNVGSRKAFLKAGFVEEARLRAQYFVNGAYTDAICLATFSPHMGLHQPATPARRTRVPAVATRSAISLRRTAR